jgi:hypothetical protein
MEVGMSLSRKRKKELKRLRASAEELWGNQQVVIEHANHVAREASRQLGNLTREEVVPRVRTGYETYVSPRLGQAKDAVRYAGVSAERGVGTVLGSLLTIGDLANDVRVRRAVNRISPTAAKVAKIEDKKKSGPGIGSILAIGAGIVAAAGVAYAVWQTFRADDELWVADEEPLSTNEANPAL